MNSQEFADKICESLQDHKGQDITRICVKEKTQTCDYFVIASGRSMTHTRSLIDNVEEDMEKLGVSPIREEGAKEGRWAVLDYGDVIVHIFNDETRLFYHLEKLWDDGTNAKKF